jgi:hypothetical protein
MKTYIFSLLMHGYIHHEIEYTMSGGGSVFCKKKSVNFF